MIISHKYKFIYFANGKCASSTIENMLAKYNDDDRIKIVDVGYGKKGIWCKKKLDNKKHIKLISRPAAAAPAVGMMKLHLEQQAKIVKEALE